MSDVTTDHRGGETLESIQGTSVNSVIEGLSIQFAPAPIPKRILAYIIDISIVSLLMYLVFLVLMLVFMGGAFTANWTSLARKMSDTILVGGIIAVVVLILVGTLSIWHGYFIYYELKKGTTPGKKIFGLRVVPLNHARLTLGQVVLRDLFRYIDAMMIIPGLVTMLLNPRRQRLGDMAAGTLVIYSKEKEAKASFLYITSEDYYALRSTLEPTEIPIEGCEAFLRFAYPLFITGRANYTSQEIDQWITYLKAFMKAPEVNAVEPMLLLRFFAELCVQAINKKGGK